MDPEYFNNYIEDRAITRALNIYNEINEKMKQKWCRCTCGIVWNNETQLELLKLLDKYKYKYSITYPTCPHKERCYKCSGDCLTCNDKYDDCYCDPKETIIMYEGNCPFCKVKDPYFCTCDRELYKQFRDKPCDHVCTLDLQQQSICGGNGLLEVIDYGACAQKL